MHKSMQRTTSGFRCHEEEIDSDRLKEEKIRAENELQEGKSWKRRVTSCELSQMPQGSDIMNALPHLFCR
jgi:hypothetical protein